MNADKLTNEIIDYYKDIDHYNFYDNYDTDEDAFDDVKNGLLKDPNKILEAVSDNIENITNYENLNDEVIKHHLDISVQLVTDLNKFINSKSNDFSI